jgi:hypothetical protein
MFKQRRMGDEIRRVRALIFPLAVGLSLILLNASNGRGG